MPRVSTSGTAARRFSEQALGADGQDRQQRQIKGGGRGGVGECVGDDDFEPGDQKGSGDGPGDGAPAADGDGDIGFQDQAAAGGGRHEELVGQQQTGGSGESGAE